MLGEGDGCQGGEGQHTRRSWGRAAAAPFRRPAGEELTCTFLLHAEELPWKHLPPKILHFPQEEQWQHIQAGICLKLGFIPIFHLERYLHVCLTKCGIMHLIKISDMLKLLDELGH